MPPLSCAPRPRTRSNPSGREFPPAAAAAPLRNRDTAAPSRQNPGKNRPAPPFPPPACRFPGCAARARQSPRNARIARARRSPSGRCAARRERSWPSSRRGISPRSSPKPPRRGPPARACRATSGSAPARRKRRTRPRPRGRCAAFSPPRGPCPGPASWLETTSVFPVRGVAAGQNPFSL